jgi:hypothetical protein
LGSRCEKAYPPLNHLATDGRRRVAYEQDDKLGAELTTQDFAVLHEIRCETHAWSPVFPCGNDQRLAHQRASPQPISVEEEMGQARGRDGIEVQSLPKSGLNICFGSSGLRVEISCIF